MTLTTRPRRTPRLWGRISALAAALAALLDLASTPPAALAGETLDRIRDSGALVMATDPISPPQSFVNAAGAYDGFDIDVAREIAARMGAELTFVTPGYDAIIAGGWEGRWDIAVSSIKPTPARDEALDFPDIYYYTPAVLAVPASGSDIASPADASGRTIGVARGGAYAAYLSGDLDKGAPSAIVAPTIVEFPNDAVALAALAAGDAGLDAVLTALPAVVGAQNAGADVVVAGQPLFLEPLAIAIDAGDQDFFFTVKGVVSSMRRDGTLAGLSIKWFGADLTE